MKLNICYLGTISYKEALDIQYQLVERRQKELINNTLLLLEHPPVLTMGTRGDYANIYIPLEQLANEGISVYKVNRGGDVTYHGPGQIVGYPIMNIKDFGGSIRQFILNIQSSIIKLLQVEFGISAYGQTDQYTGAWVGDQKITAIGIAVQKWVTMHGFAFNVNTNLKHFEWINPCGLSKGVTSIAALTGVKADMNHLYCLLADYFAKEFNCELVKTNISSLL